MIIQKNKLKKRLAVLFFAFFFVLFTLMFFWYFKFKQSEMSGSIQQKIDLSSPSQQEKSMGSEIKKQSVQNNNPETSQQENISVTITSSGQNGTTLQIRGLITPFVDKGTCTLELTRENQKVSKTSTLQTMANSATCKGFDIPISDLATGLWNISLAVSSEKGTVMDTGTVVVK